MVHARAREGLGVVSGGGPRQPAGPRPPPATDNGPGMNVGGPWAPRIPAGVPAGTLATMTMDLAMLAAARFGGPAFRSDRLGPDVIGRWAYGLSRGRWRHADIRSEPAPRGELVLGILTHYATGIVLTQAYLLLSRRSGREAEPARGDGVRHRLGGPAAPGPLPLAGLRLVRSPLGRRGSHRSDHAPRPHRVRHRDRAVGAALRWTRSRP